MKPARVIHYCPHSFGNYLLCWLLGCTQIQGLRANYQSCGSRDLNRNLGWEDGGWSLEEQVLLLCAVSNL